MKEQLNLVECKFTIILKKSIIIKIIRLESFMNIPEF